MKTLPELAQEVLDVQDTCNLSGVVHSWSRAITNLRVLMPKAGTDAINRHPINKLWADKVAHLTGTQTLLNQEVDDAYGVVLEMAKSKSGPVEPLDLDSHQGFDKCPGCHKSIIDKTCGNRDCAVYQQAVSDFAAQATKDTLHPQGL